MRQFFLVLFCIFGATSTFSKSGEVYLVLGSDTAIWEGMEVNRFHCYYLINLYTDPARNAYAVMDPAFRSKLVDSYNQPLKMTWWMMAGNIFRYANNRNVPIPNVMTMYLMQKYHGEKIKQHGDELSLHYHTFMWSDYNADGIYWWNQASTFRECRDDFNFTLSQLLLEEHVFPVSFRSGWHFMDNDWQHDLNELLPYSLHNDWPNKHDDQIEPIDNVYDWSQAPPTFVPYHPSPENYQIPGNSPGWNVRSIHFRRCITQNILDEVFKQAQQGIDQVVCIWGHLPESDFLDNIVAIDSLAHQKARQYPEVKYRYCTAVEAMQRWQSATDTTAPNLAVYAFDHLDQVSLNIRTDEPVFQPRPFVAVKDIYENYSIVPCRQIGENEWEIEKPLLKKELAKIGVAVCDKMGNQAFKLIHYLPDDIYLDNTDAGYSEVSGNWSTQLVSAWGADSRKAVLAPGDTVKARWTPHIPLTAYYNVFAQVPEVANFASHLTFKIYRSGECVNRRDFTSPLKPRDWVYVGTAEFNQGTENYLELEAFGAGQEGKIVVADVAKFSALVRERDLFFEDRLLNFNEVAQSDTVSVNVTAYNRGYQELIISAATSLHHFVSIPLQLPITIPPMRSIDLPVQFSSNTLGIITDTLYIKSNDPYESIYPITIAAQVQPYFAIIDNEDKLHYQEEGNWFYSNAQAYGPSSRYAWLHQKPGAYAGFFTTLNKNGLYEIFEIVPTTKNAANNAVYVISIANAPIDTVRINQNDGSGYWVPLGRYHFPAGRLIEVKVIDTGESTAGDVLRADAIKFALIEETSNIEEHLTQHIPMDFQVKQNYPNPFNPQTMIAFSLPESAPVTIAIFDLSGALVRRLVSSEYGAGWHVVSWDGNNEARIEATSGVYIYTITAGKRVASKKMLKIR